MKQHVREANCGGSGIINFSVTLITLAAGMVKQKKNTYHALIPMVDTFKMCVDYVNMM